MPNRRKVANWLCYAHCTHRTHTHLHIAMCVCDTIAKRDVLVHLKPRECTAVNSYNLWVKPFRLRHILHAPMRTKGKQDSSSNRKKKKTDRRMKIIFLNAHCSLKPPICCWRSTHNRFSGSFGYHLNQNECNKLQFVFEDETITQMLNREEKTNFVHCAASAGCQE